METHLKSVRKLVGGFLIAAGGVAMIATTGFNLSKNSLLGSVTATGEDYTLVLNSGNAVSSGGDHVQKTTRNADVTFTYTSVNNSSGNHCAITSGGSIVNKDIIHSLTKFKATFTGTLQARIAYTTSNWGEYFNLVSGSEMLLGSNPYYLELKATTNVVLSSAIYSYSCSINQDAESQDTEGTYDITFNAAGSDSSTELTSSTVVNQVTSGSQYISSFSGLTKIYAGTNGLKFGSSKAAGSMTITLDSSSVEESITSIDFATAQYGSDTGSFNIYLNGSSTVAASFSPSAGGSVSVTGTLTSIELETTTKRAYLCGITLNYGSSSEPGIPDTPDAVEVGFTASDANKDSYTTNSIFSVDNALSVAKQYSDGTTTSTTDFTYVIKDANDVTIDPTAKFPAEGVYTLIVSCGSYIPVEITLNVGEFIYPVDVAASMSTVTFNTADILSNNLSGNLTATVEFSDGSTSTSITYSNFADNDIAIKLLNSHGVSYDYTKPFGSAGNWTLRVYSVVDENMHYDITLTVNAIPVTSITLSETSYSMYPEDTLQLTVTVNPTNATNSNVTWSSNNDEVATVSEEGLVTAIAVGGATITATAADGSNVYGTCAITVEAKPEVQEVSDHITRETTGVTSGSTTYTSWSGKTVTSDAVYAGQSAGGNGSIQLRSNNSNSGIIQTTSGGNVTSVSLTWNSNTSSGRTLNIYGKDTAYTSPTELYNSSSQGTLLGTIVMGTSDSLDISGDYPYIGMRSNSGAMYIDEIVITMNGTGGSGGTIVYPTAINVTMTSSSIAIGQTSQLSIEYTPSDTNVKNVTYSSSNANVAAVSSTGLVTGVAQGSATITASAQAENGTISDTITITVTPVAVTSVSLNSNSETVKEGKTITLTPTVYPTNATNKNVTWTSSNTGVATVSNSGVVTGVSAGNATITVTTVDGNKTATCEIVVTAASSGGEETFSISYTDLPTSYQTGSTVYTASSGIKFQAYNCANYSKKMQFKATSGYLQNTEDLELQSITINDRESNTLTVYGSNTAGSFSTTITGEDDVYDLTGYSYFKIARTSSGAAYCSSITVLTGTPTPTDPTNIILSNNNVELAPNGTKQLSVSYVPSNANQNKAITWTSSNTNVATVDSSGLITVKSTATVGQTATITAKLTNIPTITATCTVSVVEQQIDDHTVLIYMCGADLESENYLASGDITEILKVSGQPDDVNIVIETGGAKSWSSTHGISSTNLERWHVENKSLVKDDSLTYASMGLTSTLQSFVQYGLNNYPAERTGIVFWNHGGGMRGVCYDEKKNDDVLKNSEIKSAISGALNNCGMSGQKLEWVGYDACLMAVQDIAETNSAYFNYMIASEESEAGEGWDYDTWVDDLYAKKTTPNILKAIVDGFIADNGGASSSSGDQTLSYLTLSYAAAYKTAWEAMAQQLYSKVTTSNRSSFNSAITGNIKHYGDSDYDYFCTFDAWDFIDKLANNSAFSSFRIDSSYTTAVKNAHANLVTYSVAQKGAGVSKGLCMYWPNSTQYSDVSTYYTTSETNFTQWRKLCVDRGYHA